MPQKVVIHKPGNWNQLKIEEFEIDGPGNGEIQIDVKAAGVNFADTSVRQGLYSSAKEYVGWPITPGFEIAGIVLSVGKNATDFKAGDRVFGMTLFGGYSSRLNVNAEFVRKIPGKLSYAEAASLPAVFITSFYAVYWLVRIRPGSKVLIHSAAGGMGLALTQMLKASGCIVAGIVGSSSKAKLPGSYGADKVIDKSTSDLWKEASSFAPEGYDAIFDANGLSTFKQSYRHVRSGGFLFVYGFASMLPKRKGRRSVAALAVDYVKTPSFNPFNMVKTNRSVIAFNVSYLSDRSEVVAAAFDHIIAGIDNGTLKVLPVKEYPFADVAQAHKDIESGLTSGKLMLTF